MTDFQILERRRAFARTMKYLEDALHQLRAAEHENTAFALNLDALADIDRQLLHAIHCCAHIYKQPPDTPA